MDHLAGKSFLVMIPLLPDYIARSVETGKEEFTMSFYRYHAFFCTNQREMGEACCADFDARNMRDYVKKRCKELGIHKEGGVRINIAGCLGRCELGPTIAVYPDEVWYTYVDKEDLDEIIQEHFVNGRIVDRLKI